MLLVSLSISRSRLCSAMRRIRFFSLRVSAMPCTLIAPILSFEP